MKLVCQGPTKAKYNRQKLDGHENKLTDEQRQMTYIKIP